MIVFDIESGRIDAPRSNHLSTALVPYGTDVIRHDMPCAVPRLMTLEEAMWMESQRNRAYPTQGM